MNILLVDDEPDIINCLTDCLELLGHQVDAAESGQQALATMLHRVPDLIISDIRMPEMDGIKLKQSIPDHIPFIFMSGHLDDERALQSTGINYRHFLVKPFKLAQLKASLKDVSDD
ncbi:response regulator [Motilimonas sp. E26]|uniref:response regulator n=1 Tax=Motilimonas sp. E26 TaxID=2865674 RepID=UPI001E5546DD|nr:response regulator [Motilimonas sp. E26]